MRCTAILLMLACPAIGGLAAETGPMGSDACRRALDSLGREEAGAGEGPRATPGPGSTQAGVAPALAQARRAAAVACLGPGADGASAPQRRAETPVGVPGMRIAPAVGPTRPDARSSASTQPPLKPRLPLVLTSCDTTGCWASDGTRLNRIGPALHGPRGACSVAGTAVNCP